MSAENPGPMPEEVRKQISKDIDIEIAKDAAAQDAAQAGETAKPAETSTSEEAGEAAVAKHVDVQHITDDEPLDEGRWDHDKAETLARVLKAEGELDRGMDAYEQSQAEPITLDESIFNEGRQHAQERVDLIKEELATKGRYPKGIQGILEEQLADAETRLSRAIEREPDKIEAEMQRRDEKLGRQIERIHKAADATLSPYEELYDLNSELFADMPTSEFMKKGKELADVQKQLANMELSLGEGTNELNRFATSIESKIAWSSDQVDGILMSLTNGLGMDGDEFRRTRLELREATRDFDKTPRQVMETYQAVCQKYKVQLEEKKLATEAKRTEILDRYKPELAQS